MAFPRSLDTKTMGVYVNRHFAWDRHGVAFPSLPLSKDFQALCLSFELAVAEEASEYYELPELPQVIFYAMLLNEAERLGVVQRQSPQSLELPLIVLRWSTFKSWVWLYGDRIFEAQFRPKVRSGESSRTSQWEDGSEVEPEDDSPNSSFINTMPSSHIGYSSIHLSRGSGIKYRESDQYTYFPC
ncbi:hypothetical protein Cgig2_022560 [Carnegiea gigantea]|uniref:Uncharacterized protein n=1 Tax=Carnegiea gigantea TaxID=171969 RepID=A0A9Q1KK49_9CARY|nr:hypothetical protein Cgig2_022560 [Carnegiea gigantea]